MNPQAILVTSRSERRVELEQALIQAGYSVATVLQAHEDFVPQLLKFAAGSVVIDVDSVDAVLLERVNMLQRRAPRPLLMLVEDDNAAFLKSALQVGVSAYVVRGFSAERLGSLLALAITRFEQDQALQRELTEAKSSLTERKVVERAKGILMRQRGCDEEQAYSALRKLAMDRNRRLVEVARSVVEAADLLR